MIEQIYDPVVWTIAMEMIKHSLERDRCDEIILCSLMVPAADANHVLKNIIPWIRAVTLDVVYFVPGSTAILQEQARNTASVAPSNHLC